MPVICVPINVIITIRKEYFALSTYNVNLTLENIRTISIMFLDIFIMWMVLYNTIRLVRANTKTVQIFKGVLLILVIDTLATLLGLKTVSYVTNIFMNWGFLAIIIIFQPEIRSVLERLGKSNVFTRITTLTGNEKENLVDQIVTATMLLSNDQTGALISIEQSHTLEDFIATGTKLHPSLSLQRRSMTARSLSAVTRLPAQAHISRRQTLNFLPVTVRGTVRRSVSQKSRMR